WDVTGVRSIERGNCAILIQQETVIQTVRVNEDSHYGSVRSKAPPIRTLVGARARARKSECGDDALPIPQEPVDRIGAVKVESCDLPDWADCEGIRTLQETRACSRRIERGDGAIPIPQETVNHESRVSVPSRDRPVGVDDEGAGRKGALGIWPRARARRIEDGKHALIGTNVGVDHID